MEGSNGSRGGVNAAIAYASVSTGHAKVSESSGTQYADGTVVAVVAVVGALVLLVGSVTVLAATSWQDRTRRAITTVAIIAAVVLWMNVVVPWSDRRQVQDCEIRDSYALMSPSDVVVLDGEGIEPGHSVVFPTVDTEINQTGVAISTS